MSGGEQQMLAIGRALMGQPKLLLLDEPSMGIAPILVERIYETIAEINKQGMTILLVEQNANFALEVSKRGYVLETGTVVADRRVGGAADQPRSPEGLPGNMITSSPSSGHGAVAPLPVAAGRRSSASYLSERKGYGEKPGLASGLLLHSDRRHHLARSGRPSRTRSGRRSAPSAAASRRAARAARRRGGAGSARCRAARHAARQHVAPSDAVRCWQPNAAAAPVAARGQLCPR